MDSTRRNFLQRSAAAATAVALGPVVPTDSVAAVAADESAAQRPDGVKAAETRFMRARPVPLSRVRVTGGPLKRAQDLTAKYLLELRAGAAGGRNVGIDRTSLQPSSYVELKRTWKSGDTVELTLPKTLRLEPTPDVPRIAAIMWGPLALASDLGPRLEGRAAEHSASPAPVFVTDGRPVTEWVTSAGAPADFRVRGVARVPSEPGSPATDVSLAPFYRTHRRRYGVYFDVLTASEFDAKVATLAAERERVRRLEAATLGFVQPGDSQAERTFNYPSDPADRPVGRAAGQTNRGGTGWFSFDLPVDGAGDTALVVTYFNDLGLPPASGNFEILLDGASIARFQPNETATRFFDTRYAMPADVVRGNTKVTVRFQEVADGRIAPVFGVRTVRASAYP